MKKNEFFELNEQLVMLLNERDQYGFNQLFVQDIVAQLSQLLLEMVKYDEVELKKAICENYSEIFQTFDTARSRALHDDSESLNAVAQILHGIAEVLINNTPEVSELLMAIVYRLEQKSEVVARHS
jgi:hypothetical protein